ncbi:MAG: fimbrial protein, partial [Glaciimonas sp.]|nr:fimbrial protein [Glaciimonas sp.]
MKPNLTLSITLAITLLMSMPRMAFADTVSVTATVVGATCDLAVGDVARTINLPDIDVSDFGANNYAGQTPFSLTANCSNATSTTFSFSGTPEPNDSARFKNTKTGANVASGASIWL